MTDAHNYRLATEAAALIRSLYDPLEERIAVLFSAPGDAQLFVTAGEVANAIEEKNEQWSRSDAHAIHEESWQEAEAYAKANGYVIGGYIHTHVDETHNPGFTDYRHLKAGHVGAVWHIETGKVTWYVKGKPGGAQTGGMVARGHLEPSPLMHALYRALYADPATGALLAAVAWNPAEFGIEPTAYTVDNPPEVLERAAEHAAKCQEWVAAGRVFGGHSYRPDTVAALVAELEAVTAGT
jgi:hypothetical protein